MAFYDEMAVMALAMITEFGQTLTIRDIQPGQYDAESGGTAAETIVEQEARGILIEYSGQDLLANSLIKVGDKKLKIAAAGLDWPPSVLNKVIIAGRTWSVVPPLKEINPAGTPILYELQVRS